MKSRKAKKVLLAVGMSSLCLAIQTPCMNMESYAAQADMTKNEGDTVIGIEEYGKGSDWTGWFTVTIRVLLPDGQTPAKDVFITMNPKYPAEPDYSNDQAGHGPNINGTTEYKTDENGELMFRIYPSPVEYLVRVPAGSEWSAKNYAIGSITKDNSTITIVLEKEIKPSEPETKPNPGGGSSGGGGGSSNKGNGGNDQNNGPGVTKPDNGNNQTNPPQEPDQPQKPNVPGQQPGTDKPSNPTGPETPEPDHSNDYVIPGKDLETGTKDDVTVKPGKDEKGNNNSSIDKDGKVELPDGGSVIHPTEPDRGEIKVDVPEGTVIGPDGTLTIPDGTWNRYTLPGKDSMIDTSDDVQVVAQLGKNGRDNAILREDGSLYLPDGGTVTYADGTEVDVPDGTIVLPDGTILYPDGTTSDGAAEETAAPAENGRLRFADCYFHWLELLALLSMILIAMKRLYHVKRMNEELDQLLGEGEDLSGKDKEE